MVEMFFERVFDARVPGGQRVGLGPEIADVFGPAQARSNQKIDFLISGAGAGDSVFVQDLLA